MLTILENISPVFLVIALGFMARRLGFLPDIFISSANRLVYFVAIPILVYGEISRGSFSQSFDLVQITGTYAAVFSAAVLSFLAAKALRITPGETSTFAQCSFHGNLGYVGLAVVFYALGPEGRGAASVLAGFLILFQNVVAIGIYTFTAGGGRGFNPRVVGKFLGNPIILATLLGLFSSAAGVTVPPFLMRSFDIVGDMALPLALLIIGGSLRTAPARRVQMVALSTLFKLLLLPLAGLVLFRSMGLGAVQTETAVILLASPSATVTYVMASEMGGKPDLAAAAVTISTVASIATYTLWISLVGGL
ncbi:MAG: AEC family transporter [bacterium]|nr:MAG: AEC family transporter [bacterium]